MTSRRLVVVGTLACDPYAGMAWMNMQIVEGLRRLGHDAYYFEISSTWPYDPLRGSRVDDSDYAAPYLARVASVFGLGDRWAYRRSYLDGAWLGMSRSRAEDLLATADAVFNVTGVSDLPGEGLDHGRLVFYGTDPVWPELMFANGDEKMVATIGHHDDVVTYGENIGVDGCPVPPLPKLRARTRQPVLVDLWKAGPPTRDAFTTVGNWMQGGRDVEYGDDTFLWSKHHEFMKFIDLPRHVTPPLELATNLADRSSIRHRHNDEVLPMGMDEHDLDLLTSHGWQLVSGTALSTHPSPYRDYIVASRGEFTVARDLNVRLESGWFSERSACYLAAGRPVITQDTGFSRVLPTGEGLFAFKSMHDAVSAFDAVLTDYERHSSAAQAIAREYFQAEVVLSKLLQQLGL